MHPLCCQLSITLVCLTLWATSGFSRVAWSTEPEVTKIWDKAPNSAFTDLIRWQDKFYCTFREGERHVHGADGKVRLISSEDGETWESVALWEEPGIDLRDPKLSITPDGRLMILMGGSRYVNREIQGRLTRVAFLAPGQTEAERSVPVEIDEEIKSNNDWLWRVVWHKGVGYGTLYQPKPTGNGLFLLSTTDGIHYKGVDALKLSNFPGEATPLFLDDYLMIVVVRLRETMALAIGTPPYSNWEYHEVERPLGGPDLELLPGGTIVLGTRAFDDPERKRPYTALGTLTLKGEFTERVRLPSGGDTSYPGMVVHAGKLWVSYYSSHEGKTSIYLAKIPLETFEE
jgi:hypothetical protein